jgi:hypothetical protein
MTRHWARHIVQAGLSDKLSDDRGDRQRTPVDVDGRLKLFMHLPEQVEGT